MLTFEHRLFLPAPLIPTTTCVTYNFHTRLSLVTVSLELISLRKHRFHEKWVPVKPSMTRPQVRDGRTVSNMDGSFEYIE
jgi:hypothetical protein